MNATFYFPPARPYPRPPTASAHFMTRFFVLSALLLIPLLSATGQSTRDDVQGTWEHTFEDKDPTETVYLQFDGKVLEVWRITETEKCEMYPSVVDWSNQKISLGTHMEWSITSVTEDALRINFPGGYTVRYQRARLEPRSLCGGRDI